MASYSFVTLWQMNAPIERVWDAVYHSERWPEWWPGVERVIELQPAADNGLGGRQRYVWKSILPYRLTIDMATSRVEPPFVLEGQASGELEGTGRWELSRDDGLTTARCIWTVTTTKPWMNLVAPLARPLFEWNHEIVMRQGGDSLRRLLEGPSDADHVTGLKPDRVAYLEAAGWRAYYNRQWVRALWLMVQLAREQFGLPWLRAAQAAYDITRAMIAWAPAKNNPVRAQSFISAFYRVARAYGQRQRFDPEAVAKLELDYWRIHRELSGRPNSEKRPLEDVLERLHSALFGVSPEQARPSARNRARAADTVDVITSRQSTDVALDWSRTESYLRSAYRSLSVDWQQRDAEARADQIELMDR